MGNNIQKCQPTLTRASYFPGNLLEGSVQVVASENVEFYGIRVYVEGVAWYRWETGSGKHRHVHYSTNIFSKTVITVAGDSEEAAAQKKNTYTLTKGEHVYPFACMLSPATLPTAQAGQGSTRARVFWRVRAVVDVSGRLNEAGECGFEVYSAMPAQLHSMPSAKTQSFNEDVTCCCCCSKGKIGATATVDKTNVSLDRDSINFTVMIDNTQGEDDIEAITACAAVTCIPKIGPTQLRPTEAWFSNRIPVKVPAGQQGQVQGAIQLKPGAPPTITSAVCDYKWNFVAIVEESGCYTVNPRLPIEINVAHYVDATGVAQMILQQQLSFQPIMNPAMLTQPGLFEVPNYANQTSPSFSQVPAPQGYAMNQQGMQNPAMAWNGQPQMTNYAAGGMPPPPPTGAFPGFTTFPEGAYFVEAQKSQTYDAAHMQ